MDSGLGLEIAITNNISKDTKVAYITSEKYELDE